MAKNDTMELDAIMEETKRRRNQSSVTKAVNAANSNDYVDISQGYPSSQNKSKRSSSNQNLQDRRNKNKKAKKGNKKGLKKGLIIAGSAVAALAIAFGVWYFFFSASDKFANNITVNNISISGMTMKEAQDTLKKEEDKLSNKLEITVTAEKKEAKLTKDDFKISFDTQKILDEAMEYSMQKGFKTEEKVYTIKMILDPESCKDASETAAKTLNRKPTNAFVKSFNSEDVSFEYKKETTGVEVDKDAVSKQLQDFIKDGTLSGKIEAAAKTLKPQYTQEYLEKNIKLLSEYSTTSTNSEAGNHNMATALAACDGSIINPGKSFSFNDHTGDSNLASNGYQPAGVIVEGKHVTGIGGGICQSSTTIYNAALMAGMETEERACHYYPSSYVDPGRDATVDYGNIDLVMKNIFPYQLFLRCYMDGVTLHAEFYGIPNKDFDNIELASNAEYRANGDVYATLKRIYYKDGEEVKSDSCFTSLYHTKGPGSSDDANSNSSGNNNSQSDDDDDNGSSSTSGGGSSSKPAPTPSAPEPDISDGGDDGGGGEESAPEE